MRHIAIIGSGPAGYYTAEAALKAFGDDVCVDMIDRLPVPYGLIRFGVAPDHQSIKGVARRYEKTALNDNVHFCGNVNVGTDISLAELQDLYDAVILATGAPNDRKLTIDGADLPGVIGSAAFVGWYNGHPDFVKVNPPLTGKNVVIVGNGNVALDVARILAKSQEELAGSDIVNHALAALKSSNVETITVLGRRGPQQIAMTPKELSELGKLERASPHVDPADFPPASTDEALEAGQRKSVKFLREYSELNAASHTDKTISIVFDFFASPVAVKGQGKAEILTVERTALDADSKSTGTGEYYDLPCDLLVSCIGYRSSPIIGAPYDERQGRFVSEDGHIQDNLYCVGWARRGPTGTIGTNRPDGYAIIDLITGHQQKHANKQGRAGLDALLKQRNVELVTFRDWQNIDKFEIEHAREGAPREKMIDTEKMVASRAIQDG